LGGGGGGGGEYTGPTGGTGGRSADAVIADVVAGKISPTDSVVKDAMSVLGLREGQERNQLIDYLKHAGKGYVDPNNRWCAAFVNAALERSGIQGTGSAAAGSFRKWGNEVKEYKDIKEGDVLVNNIPSRTGLLGDHVVIAAGKAVYRNGKWTVPTIEGNHANKVSSRQLDLSSSRGWIARRAGDRETAKIQSQIKPQSTEATPAPKKAPTVYDGIDLSKSSQSMLPQLSKDTTISDLQKEPEPAQRHTETVIKYVPGPKSKPTPSEPEIDQSTEAEINQVGNTDSR